MQKQLRREFRARKLANYKVLLEKYWDCDVINYPWQEDPPLLDLETDTNGNHHIVRIPGPPNSIMSTDVALTLCNKTTMLYVPNSARLGLEERQKHSLSAAGDLVFKQWFKLLVPPRIDFDFYFAQPVQIRKSGDSPSSAEEFIELHRKFCQTASETLEEKAYYDCENDCEGRRKRLPCDRAQNYTILPLCKAILAIFDQPNPPKENGAPSKLNVLLVRTGDETLLSKLVDFTPLMQHALPRGDSDNSSLSSACEAMGVQDSRTIRVPLDIAVKFMYNLQMREEIARPDLYSYLAKGGDMWKNPFLIRTDTNFPYYPQDEEDFLKEVYNDELYWDGGVNGDWIQSARKRMRSE